MSENAISDKLHAALDGVIIENLRLRKHNALLNEEILKLERELKQLAADLQHAYKQLEKVEELERERDEAGETLKTLESIIADFRVVKEERDQLRNQVGA